MEVVSNNTKYNINDCFSILHNLHNSFLQQSEIDFQTHKSFGYLSSCPSLFGYGLELNFTINLKHLHKHPHFEEIINSNFDCFNYDNNCNSLTLTSKYKFCYISETQFIETIYTRLVNIILLDMEKEYNNI